MFDYVEDEKCKVLGVFWKQLNQKSSSVSLGSVSKSSIDTREHQDLAYGIDSSL